MNALAVSIVILLACTTAYADVYPAGWVDLYKPPYENLPTIIASLACLESDYCYIPGMTNGVGIDIYTMNGEYNAALNAMQIEGEIPVAIMGITAGGTKAKPHGVAGGPDVLGGLKYLANTTSWTAPLALPFVALIGITSDIQTGLRVAFPDLLIEGLWLSNDGGFEYSMKNTSHLILPTDNCTWARFVAIPTPNIIYMTYGNFPNSEKSKAEMADFLTKRDPASSFEFHYAAGRSIEVSGDGKRVKHHRQRAFGAQKPDHLDGMSSSSSSSSDNPNNHCPYSAAVVKSTDGGNTWTTLVSELGTYYPNEIACATATHCAFVTHSATGIGIMRTTDGVHFAPVFSLNNTNANRYSLRSIAVSPVNSSLWFAAGNLETTEAEKGFVARSEDGGKTWVAETPLNFLAEIMKVTFSRDGVAFAAAETLFQAGTILRYTPSGPPQTPAPAYNGPLTQKVFATGDCSGAANTTTITQGQCLQSTGGGTMTMTCDMTDGVVLQNLYFLSNNCQGPAEQAAAPFGVCLEANGGGTVEFFCSPQSEQVQVGSIGVSVKKH